MSASRTLQGAALKVGYRVDPEKTPPEPTTLDYVVAAAVG
jgi:hypothetical protein